MDIPYPFENLDATVGRYFSVESVTRGSSGPKDYIARYSGHLKREDSAAVYDELASQLSPFGVTPLFRKEENSQAIILVPSQALPRATNPLVSIGLYILTLFSVFFVGVFYAAGDPSVTDTRTQVLLGAAYTASLLAILTAHEFGHYLVGRYHKEAVSPPYFIPMPLPPFGTMGAVINMKRPPKNRRNLLDIGIAGPLAGLIVAIPILLLGLSLSPVNRLVMPSGPDVGLTMEGNSILYLLAKLAVFGQLLPAPPSYGDLPPFLYWIRYFFTSRPFPAGGFDVTLHPVAWAGWAGILVTALNLIPAGQLDGGHMIYVLFGAKRARMLMPFILVAMVLLGFVWSGWWLWAALIYFLIGRSYAEPLDQITPLDPPRRLLAVLALVIFVLVFTPVPMQTIVGR
jgi:membrane-associated protease RseP (regulator of RpoE activity)